MERNVVFNGGVDVEEVVELLPHTHHNLGLNLNNRGINAQCTSCCSLNLEYVPALMFSAVGNNCCLLPCTILYVQQSLPGVEE